MFNPNARWDRKLPSEPLDLDESVEVNVTFSKGQIRPLFFVWKGQDCQIKEITYKWQETRDGARVFCFSVHDGTNLFQLNLNNRFMNWRLVKICAL